jgi:hypothetical protein
MVARPSNGQLLLCLAWAWSATASSPGCLPTRGIRAPTRLLLGWPGSASCTGERVDPGGGEEARRLNGGDHDERAAQCGGGEHREVESRSINLVESAGLLGWSAGPSTSSS